MIYQKLNDYKFENTFGTCTVLTTNGAGTMTNADKTGRQRSV